MKSFLAIFIIVAIAGVNAGGPNADWARAPHDTPARKGENGRLEMAGTGAATGAGSESATEAMTGLAPMPRRPTPVVAPCADCGAKDNKPEDTHPVIDSVHHVYHPRTKDAYNATGDYRGEGTPVSGVVVPDAKKGPNCCRVCAPAKECKHKNNCFNVCKRVCGPTCEIPEPVKCVKAPCANATATKPMWVAPKITDEMKAKVHAASPEEKVGVIVSLLRGQKHE